MISVSNNPITLPNQTLRALTTIISYIILAPVILILCIASPFFLVRIGKLPSGRLGHFTCNVELYLHELSILKNFTKVPIKDLWFTIEPVCNNYLLAKWKNILNILDFNGNHLLASSLHKLFATFQAYCEIFPFLKKHIITTLQHDRDVYGLFRTFPPNLVFTKQETILGNKYLASKGLKPGGKFVVFTIRDDRYLKEYMPDVDFSYHAFRDATLANYYAAMIDLAERGFIVFRVGASVNKPLSISHPNIIDYAVNGDRTEFLDVFLGANCHFCVTQGTGYDGIPKIFRRPLVFVNLAPYALAHTECDNSICIFKSVRDIPTGKLLTQTQIRMRGLAYAYSSKTFELANVRLEENDSEDIRQACSELISYLDPNVKSIRKITPDQQRFWDIFRSYEKKVLKNGAPLHGEIKIKIPEFYLQKYPNWMT